MDRNRSRRISGSDARRRRTTVQAAAPAPHKARSDCRSWTPPPVAFGRSYRGEAAPASAACLNRGWCSLALVDAGPVTLLAAPLPLLRTRVAFTRPDIELAGVFAALRLCEFRLPAHRA